MAQRTEPWTYADQIAYTAECILEAARPALEYGGREYPDIAYLNLGQAVYDGCEQITVTLIQTYTGTPGDQTGMPTPCDGPASGVFNVELVRCLPVPNLKQREKVSPEKNTDAAKGVFTDAACLLKLANYLPYPEFDRLTLSDVTVGEPSGGFVSVNLNIVVGLP